MSGTRSARRTSASEARGRSGGRRAPAGRDAGHADARFRRARAALDAGSPQEALEHLARIPRDEATKSPAWYLLHARAQQQQGRTGDAIATLEEGLDILRSPELPVALSEIHAGLGDFEAAAQALSALETRARTQQERSDAVARRVRLLIRAGHPADALQQARRALGIDPGRLDLWNLAADLARAARGYAGAV